MLAESYVWEARPFLLLEGVLVIKPSCRTV